MTEKKSDKTRARILDAAAEVLAQHGYNGTRLEDIARVADIKAGSMYYYFDSREDLVEEVLTIAVSGVMETVKKRVRELPKDATFRDKISAAIETNLMMALEHDAYTAASLRIAINLPPLLRRRQLAMQRSYGVFWRKLLQGAKAAGEIDPKFDLSVLRMLVLGAINWSVEWYKPGGPLTAAQVAAQLSALVFDGITPACDEASLSRAKAKRLLAA